MRNEGARADRSEGGGPPDAAALAGVARALGEDDALDEAGASDGGSARGRAAAERFGAFTIERPLGAGGGGAVYLAVADGSSLPVALKVFNPAVAASARLRRELDIHSSLRVEGLVRVRDHGTCEGRWFLATEYVDGVPIDRHCDERALSDRDRAALLAHLADIIQRLHERGVLHRDLKPGNVLVDRAGVPVVIDLGLAVSEGIDDPNTVTLEGATLGTPAFMPPEQARGEKGAHSVRSDVYALGAIGYVLLAGQPPHAPSGSVHAQVKRAADEPARDPRQIRPALPAPLRAVLAKAAAYRPHDRYESAAALAADLRRWLSGEPVLAAPPTPWVRATRWAAGHPLLTTGGACAMMIAATLAGVAGFAAWSSHRPSSVRLLVDEDGRGYGVQVLTPTGALYGPGIEFENVPIKFARGMWMDSRLVPVVGFGQGAAQHEGHVVAFDGRLDRVLWSDPGPSTTPEAMLAVIESSDPTAYYPGAMTIADVFDGRSPNPTGADVSGREIVVTYHHSPNSPSAVRVLSARGELLYEAWHDGHMMQLTWVGSEGLLVLAGMNSECLMEHREGGAPAETLGAGFGEPRFHTHVVYAIRPEIGSIGERISWPSLKPTGTIEPAWYHAVLPDDAMRYASEIELAQRGGMPVLHVKIDGVGVAQFEIDAEGHATRIPVRGGVETVAQRFGIDPQTLHLGPLPLPTREGARDYSDHGGGQRPGAAFWDGLLGDEPPE